VDIGPNVVIEDEVRIHSNVKIMSGACIFKGTEIGSGTVIHPGAVIGNDPQDLAFKGGESFTKIGENNVIRENVSIHKGTKEGSSTIIGNNNYLMVQCHLGHNCKIGNNSIIAPGALLAGHVEVGDRVFISGNVVFHQFCRVGKLAMVGGFTGVNKDVPPYMNVRGPSALRGVNLVGLRRAGFSREKIEEIRDAYKILFLSGNMQEKALGILEERFSSEEIRILIDFIRSTKRGICRIRFSKEEFFD